MKTGQHRYIWTNNRIYCSRGQKKTRLFTFTLKSVEWCGEQQPVSHVRRSSTTSNTYKNTYSASSATFLTHNMKCTKCKMQYFGYRYSNSVRKDFFLLTWLFKASLDPLREPAQVTVTVQGVGTKSPGHTHTTQTHN